MAHVAVIAAWAGLGFLVAAAVLMWLERGPAILLDLKALSTGLICL